MLFVKVTKIDLINHSKETIKINIDRIYYLSEPCNQMNLPKPYVKLWFGDDEDKYIMIDIDDRYYELERIISNAR